MLVRRHLLLSFAANTAVRGAGVFSDHTIRTDCGGRWPSSARCTSEGSWVGYAGEHSPCQKAMTVQTHFQPGGGASLHTLPPGSSVSCRLPAQDLGSPLGTARPGVPGAEGQPAPLGAVQSERAWAHLEVLLPPFTCDASLFC